MTLICTFDDPLAGLVCECCEGEHGEVVYYAFIGGGGAIGACSSCYEGGVECGAVICDEWFTLKPDGGE